MQVQIIGEINGDDVHFRRRFFKKIGQAHVAQRLMVTERLAVGGNDYHGVFACMRIEQRLDF